MIIFVCTYISWRLPPERERVLGKGCVVEVDFMPPIRPVAFPDRKSLASASERAVRRSLLTTHRGY